jgi:hypothetical protein
LVFLTVSFIPRKAWTPPHVFHTVKAKISTVVCSFSSIRRTKLEQRSRRPLRSCFGAYIGRGVVEVKVGRIGNDR